MHNTSPPNWALRIIRKAVDEHCWVESTHQDEEEESPGQKRGTWEEDGLPATSSGDWAHHWQDVPQRDYTQEGPEMRVSPSTW